MDISICAHPMLGLLDPGRSVDSWDHEWVRTGIGKQLVSVTAVGTTGKQKGFPWILFRVFFFVFFFVCFLFWRVVRSLFQEHLGKTENWQNTKNKWEYSSLAFCIFVLQSASRQQNCQLQKGGFIVGCCCLGKVFPALSTETLKIYQVCWMWVS